MTQHREEALDASWDDLKLFLACAKYKSFRNAADELGLTSTTLMRWEPTKMLAIETSASATASRITTRPRRVAETRVVCSSMSSEVMSG